MRNLAILGLLFSSLIATSRCPIKNLEGKWAGTYESNDGSTWATIIEIGRTTDCEFQGQIHWIEYFNTKNSFVGTINSDGTGSFKELDILQGINSPQGTIFSFVLKDFELTGRCSFNNNFIGSFNLKKWEQLNPEVVESFEEILTLSESKYGTTKIGSKIEVDPESFFNKYLEMTNGSTFYYESMLEWKTILSANYEASEFVASKRGKFFRKETWGDNVYLNGHIDTIQWSYDPSKDEVSWDKYEMDELGDNRFIDGLGQMKDAELLSSRKAWIEDKEYIRLELRKNETISVFYVNPKTMKVHRAEFSDQIHIWEDYQFYQTWLIPKYYTIQYLDSKYEARIDSLFFDRPISDEMFQIPEFVRKRLITSKVKRPKDYYNASQAAFENKNYSEALRQIDLALKLESNNAQYYFFRGKIRSYLDDKYGALSDFTTAIQHDSKHTESYNLRGILKYELKDYQSAIKDFKEANSIDNSHVTSLFNIGSTFSQFKSYDSADFYLRKAISLDSTNTSYLINLGVINGNRKNYPEAIKAYKEAISLGSTEHSTYNRLGVAYYFNKDYDSAKFAFMKALEIEPESYQYLVNLGNTLYQLEESKEAIKIIEKAFKIENKEDHDLINKLGLCYYRIEDYDYAIVLFTKAIDIKAMAVYYDNRAYSKSQTMDYQGAIEDFGMSIQLDPKDPKIWLERGKLKLSQHNNFEACSDFKKAMELGNEDASSLITENCK